MSGGQQQVAIPSGAKPAFYLALDGTTERRALPGRAVPDRTFSETLIRLLLADNGRRSAAGGITRNH